MNKPQFGVKDYKVVQKRWIDGNEDGDNPVIDLLEIEFLNGRVYRSKWGKSFDTNESIPCTRIATHRDDDTLPMEERDMEFLVAEHLCHEFFNPARQSTEQKSQ